MYPYGKVQECLHNKKVVYPTVMYPWKQSQGIMPPKKYMSVQCIKTNSILPLKEMCLATLHHQRKSYPTISIIKQYLTPISLHHPTVSCTTVYHIINQYLAPQTGACGQTLSWKQSVSCPIKRGVWPRKPQERRLVSANSEAPEDAP